MLLKAGSALLLVLMPDEQVVGTPTRWIGLEMLAFTWISTLAVQTSLHAKLAMGFDRVVWHRLLATNWLRTIAWTVGGIVALLLLG